MANNESTAINELIHLVASKKIDRDSSEDLMFRAPGAPNLRGGLPGVAAPMPRQRAPKATPPQVPPQAVPAVYVARYVPQQHPVIVAPPPPSVEIDDEATEIHDEGRPTLHMDREAATNPVEKITATAAVRPLAMPLPGAMRRPLIDQLIATTNRYAVPIGGLAVLAACLGGYLALRGDDAVPQAAAAGLAAPAPVQVVAAPAEAPAAAPAETVELPSESTWKPRATVATLAAPTVAEPAAVAEPAVAEPAVVAAPAAVDQPVAEPAAPTVADAIAAAPSVTRAAAQKLVAVRIESSPSGATAMLIDSGATSVLGTTPLDASLDPAKSYEVVLTLEGHETKVAKLDPAETIKVAVAFDPSADAGDEIEIAEPIVKKKSSRSSKRARAKLAKAAKKAQKKTAKRARVAKAVRAPIQEVAIPRAAGEKAKGNGKLSVTSNLPALIYVDGRSTGLTTPQKMSLGEGKHNVTLLDPKTRKAKTTSVEIVAGKAAAINKTF